MYISIDMGATNTRVASTEDLENILEIKKFKTAPDLSEQSNLLLEAINKVAPKGNIQKIVIGVPGKIDLETRKFVNLPNFPYLNSKNFTDLIDVDNTIFTNDALLGGLAEAEIGSGAEYGIIAFITLGTGVGGVRIQKENGSLSYFMAEPGHQIITRSDRFSDITGLSGTLELHVSGKSFKEIYGKNPEDCEDEEIWRDYSYFLTMGLINILALWNPEVIIFGGSVSNKFNTFMPFVVEEFSKQRFFDPVNVKQAKLGDDSGVYGGFIFLKNLIK